MFKQLRVVIYVMEFTDNWEVLLNFGEVTEFSKHE